MLWRLGCEGEVGRGRQCVSTSDTAQHVCTPVMCECGDGVSVTHTHTCTLTHSPDHSAVHWVLGFHTLIKEEKNLNLGKRKILTFTEKTKVTYHTHTHSLTKLPIFSLVPESNEVISHLRVVQLQTRLV